jgi:cellulose synthase/poly-beta-1,6-N-acetylglucosamine synthase-like glycosyltransferase
MRPVVVVPAYNEASTVGDVVAGARRYATVVVVDDGSTDATAAVGRAAGGDVVRHRVRLGKGQALRSGIAAARARGATHVVTLDGDGQHDPRDLPAVLEAMRQHPRALVIGRRCDVDGTGLSRGRAHAIRVAGFFANWATGRQVVDTQSGFRVYPLAIFEDVHPRSGGFVFETEVLLDAATRGWDVIEVDVRARPRATQRSRFRPLVDGVRIGTCLGKRVTARWVAEAVAAMRETPALTQGDFVSGRIRHPRVRRAALAAGATVAMPLLAAAAVAQTLVPWRRVDVVRPVIERFYSQTRLGSV